MSLPCYCVTKHSYTCSIQPLFLVTHCNCNSCISIKKVSDQTFLFFSADMISHKWRSVSPSAAPSPGTSPSHCTSSATQLQHAHMPLGVLRPHSTKPAPHFTSSPMPVHLNLITYKTLRIYLYFSTPAQSNALPLRAERAPRETMQYVN